MRENTAARWGSVSIGLHWTIAALVLLVQVPAGITMVAVGPGMPLGTSATTSTRPPAS